ncbi:hypothetical protein WR164_08650 [Philodulcilactobacillus myokoensis]|uniref:Tetratricopeptide repeat protein 21A/21B fourth ARM domain-containing protein n=1 Tax=Philodulcilactobacillus myokoensis TaxID=2929573 RepID=A0A9W6B159_9LACO|nr:tetratricopeptide repeat protein [Philodulcilactobacillus myokoensis]GLB46886.1 hypothetical protein WR164_08650 [Philodulcilactobacillus myokoensis]
MIYSKLALDALKKGDMKNFKKNYSLALHEDNDDYLYSLAEELYGYGITDRSKKIYLHLLKKYPDEDEIRTNLADIAIGDGKNDLALNYLSQVKKTSPAYVKSLMVAADLYQTQGLPEISKQKLIEAHQIAPGENVIVFALAELYYGSGDFTKSIPLYINLLKKGILNYSSVNLVERIGMAYANAGQFDHAIGYLKQIKPAQMSSNIKFELAFTYLQLHDYENAETVFKDLRNTDSQYATLYPYLGEALEKQHHNDDALKVYQEGLGVDQYNEKLWVKAADVSLKLNLQKQAEKYFIRAHDIAPDDISIALKYSNLLLDQKRYQDNIHFLNQYVQTNDLDPQIYWNLAISYQNTDDYQLASDYYQSAEPFFFDNSNFLKQAALFFREAGKPKETKKLLKQYVHLVPTDQEMIEMLNEYH